MERDLNPLAMRMRATRMAYGLLLGVPEMSMREFSEQLKLEAETYRRYERGETEPPMGVFVAIHRLTGISLDYLLAGDQDNPMSPDFFNAECEATFGERLMWARELQGASQEKAAQSLNVPLWKWKRWESDRLIMPAEMVKTFAAQASVSIDFLAHGLPRGLQSDVLAKLRMDHPTLWRQPVDPEAPLAPDQPALANGQAGAQQKYKKGRGRPRRPSRMQPEQMVPPPEVPEL